MSRLFSYKLTHDSGFAPNPFWGILTIATCKPGFRQSKRPGDWIAGFTSKELCGDPVGQEKLIFLMKVDEKIPLADYYNDRKFQRKIPNSSAREQIHRAGDNIYFPLASTPATANDYEQLPNPHHNDNNKINDIGGQNVLIATEFVYFGRNALTIPPDLRPDIPKGQSKHGNETRDERRANKFIKFVIRQGLGRRIHAAPHNWPAGDQSWRDSR
jgi:hypothetical protein